MATKTKQRLQSNKLDIYERVTEIVIKRLEEGGAPWQSSSIATVGFPRNYLTKQFYRGVNVFLLASASDTSPWFLTYKQAQQMGGQVRKGEKGHLIVKYGTFEKEDQDPQTGDTETVKRGYLRGYTVFNSSQIDGIDFPEIKHPEYKPSERTALAQQIIEGMPKAPKLEEGLHANPHYRPKADLVGMPDRRTYDTEESFYLDLFHEFTHATGHQSRLARKTLLESKGIMATDTAKKTYAKEELVAEMGAAFLAAHAGIVMDDFKNSAAYLQSWLKVLKVKQNRRWIVEASSQAQKATEFILNKPLQP